MKEIQRKKTTTTTTKKDRANCINIFINIYCVDIWICVLYIWCVNGRAQRLWYCIDIE